MNKTLREDCCRLLEIMEDHDDDLNKQLTGPPQMLAYTISMAQKCELVDWKNALKQILKNHEEKK